MIPIQTYKKINKIYPQYSHDHTMTNQSVIIVVLALNFFIVLLILTYDIVVLMF